MRLSRSALALVLAPSLALAQGYAGSGTARRTREAGEQLRADGQARDAKADAQLEAEPDAPRDPAATAVEAPPRAGIDLDGEGADAGAREGAEPAETYTVQRGDTLWDLSARFLNSPWYWPRLWSYNPQVANPHWIYPGNVLRFYPGGDGKPPRIEVASGEPRQVPETEGERGADDDAVTVGGRYKIGYAGSKGAHTRRDSFVTDKQMSESGVITASFEEKQLLSVYDRAYVRFGAGANVQPGSVHVLFRKDKVIRHPVTGEVFGFRTTIMGTARVLTVEGDVASVEIARAFDPIERGMFVGPWSDVAPRRVGFRPNQRAMTGVIVSTFEELVSEIGQYHVVFVDKGRADGVEEGNVFTVVRSGDPYGKNRNEVVELTRSPQLPAEDVGTLLVLDLHERTSSALVVRSLRELFVGDRVEMRVASAGKQ